MKALRICGFALVLVLGIILLSSSITVAQDSDPESIYRAAYAAFNAGDVDGGMAFIADDVVGVLLPPPPGVEVAQVGKEPFRQVMADAVAINMHWELSDFHVKGETASYTVNLEADDIFANRGVYPLEFTGFVVVRDGLILSEVWNMTAASRAKIDKALIEIGNEEVVRRYMEELWNQGDLSVANELIAEDFVSHNFPVGDRAALVDSIVNFHAEFPNAYFAYDDITVTADRVFIVNTMMVRPEGASADVEGEPAGGPMVLILGMVNGQITDRWLYMYAPDEIPAPAE